MQEPKRWTPPDPGTLKINVDGAYNPNFVSTVVRVIIRDYEGHVKLTAWCLLFHYRDAKEAKAKATTCREGIGHLLILYSENQCG